VTGQPGSQPPLLPECHDDVCITCSDQAVAVEVVELLPGGLAVVDTGRGHLEEVSVALVEAQVGGRVLVHAKEAIAVVYEREEPDR
jgi:hydrogenase expression/formation protein HypC